MPKRTNLRQMHDIRGKTQTTRRTHHGHPQHFRRTPMTPAPYHHSVRTKVNSTTRELFPRNPWDRLPTYDRRPLPDTPDSMARIPQGRSRSSSPSTPRPRTRGWLPRPSLGRPTTHRAELGSPAARVCPLTGQSRHGCRQRTVWRLTRERRRRCLRSTTENL